MTFNEARKRVKKLAEIAEKDGIDDEEESEAFAEAIELIGEVFIGIWQELHKTRLATEQLAASRRR